MIIKFNGNILNILFQLSYSIEPFIELYKKITTPAYISAVGSQMTSWRLPSKFHEWTHFFSHPVSE